MKLRSFDTDYLSLKTGLRELHTLSNILDCSLRSRSSFFALSCLTFNTFKELFRFPV